MYSTVTSTPEISVLSVAVKLYPSRTPALLFESDTAIAFLS